MTTAAMQGTNGEHTFRWQCWNAVPAEHRDAIAQWAASYPSPLPGAGLQLLRECIGISKRDLAGYLGVALRHVTRWESARPNASPMADRALRVIYLNSIGDRSTLADIRALLELTQNWPQWVRLELRAYGWRAVSYGPLQQDTEKAPQRARKVTRAPRKSRLGLRLVRNAA